LKRPTTLADYIYLGFTTTLKYVSYRPTTTGWSKKRHKVNDTIILQPYVIESCGFQQNVPKEILYMTEISI